MTPTKKIDHALFLQAYRRKLQRALALHRRKRQQQRARQNIQDAIDVWKNLPEDFHKAVEEMREFVRQNPTVPEEPKETVSESNDDLAMQSKAIRDLYGLPSKLTCSCCGKKESYMPLPNGKGHRLVMVAEKPKNYKAIKKMRKRIREREAKSKQ